MLLLILQEESEVVTISGYHDVPQNSEESLLKALANQPVSVAIEASGRDFQFYSGVSFQFVHAYLISHRFALINQLLFHGKL